jgi:predicted PurR-regulated permease PerM
MAIAATTLVLVAGIAASLAIVVPAVIDEGRTVQERFPKLRDDAARLLQKHNQPDLANQVRRFELKDVIRPTQLANSAPRGLGVIVALVTLLILTIYILSEAERIERFVYFLFPPRFHVHIDNLSPALAATVGGYLRGQLITSGAIAIFVFVILLAVGAPNALGLGVLAGIADAVPIVGAIIVVVAATLAALSVSTAAGIIVLVLTIAYQQLEDRILVPRVYGKTLRLAPVAVLLSVLIGAKLMGIIGALLALPAAAAVRTVLQYISAVNRGRVAPVDPADDLMNADEGTGGSMFSS